MTVANGRQILSVSGPPNLPVEVLAAMQRSPTDASEMIALTGKSRSVSALDREATASGQ